MAHYDLGYMLNKRGMKAAALQEFTLALQVNPGMALARQWVERLSREGVGYSPAAIGMMRGQVQDPTAFAPVPSAPPMAAPPLPAPPPQFAAPPQYAGPSQAPALPSPPAQFQYPAAPPSQNSPQWARAPNAGPPGPPPPAGASNPPLLAQREAWAPAATVVPPAPVAIPMCAVFRR